MGLRVFLKQLGSGDVRGHQVGGELDSFEGKRQSFSQRTDQQCLRQAGHTYEEAVALREYRNHHFLDDIFHADDYFT